MSNGCYMETLEAGARNRDELPAMLATLSSYDNLFGPNHPMTLRLRSEIGIALWRRGELTRAQMVLERSIRDVTGVLGRYHEWRPRLLAALRDLVAQLGARDRAAALQREILECQETRLGTEHPEALAAREMLVRMLWTTSSETRSS